MRKRKKQKNDIVIDLTSLLDVIFIILLIVLCGQSFETQKKTEGQESAITAAEAAETEFNNAKQLYEDQMEMADNLTRYVKAVSISVPYNPQSVTKRTILVLEKVDAPDGNKDGAGNGAASGSDIGNKDGAGNGAASAPDGKMDGAGNGVASGQDGKTDGAGDTAASGQGSGKNKGKEIQKFELTGNDTDEAFEAFEDCLKDYILQNEARPVILSLNEDDGKILYRDELAVGNILSELAKEYDNVYIK